MSLMYTEEQKALIALVKEMAENEIKPYVKDADEKGECPKELYKWGFDMGLHMLEVPAEYGGAGLSYETTAMIFEELAKVDAGYAITFVTSFVALRNVILAGTKEQGQYFADKVAPGTFAGFALTEPNAGSDASGQQTMAVLEGDHYVLNGTKCFITNATEADIFVVFAMTDKSKGNHGISAFIVEKDFPGFSQGKHEKKMGIRGSATSDLIFEDCIVPKENMLGKEGKGFKVAMGTLDGGRVGVAAQATGIAEGAIEETVKYTKERMQFKKRISQFQNTQFQLADMKTRADAAQLLVYRAAAAKDAGDPDTGFYSAMAKLFASETASDVTRRAVQLFGGYGYTREYPVERMMRDAKITEIYEGTSEVQRMVISSHLGVK